MHLVLWGKYHVISGYFVIFDFVIRKVYCRGLSLDLCNLFKKAKNDRDLRIDPSVKYDRRPNATDGRQVNT